MNNLGLRIKKRREYLNVHLGDLAAKVGVSSSLLSQIENGKAYPSIFTLKNIAQGLSTTVGGLIGENEIPSSYTVIRKEDRILQETSDEGCRIYLIQMRDPVLSLSAYLFELDPSGIYKDTKGFLRGRQIWFANQGSLSVELEGEIWALSQGDSMWVRNEGYAVLSNPGEKECEMLAVAMLEG